jgi:hypothetical protein
MIPYDDLVAALTNWRARQGLPVQGGAPPISAVPAPIQHATAAAVSSSTKQGPPAPPRGPAAANKGSGGFDAYADSHDALDVDDAALLDESSYENEGNDFAMAFGQLQQNDESTAIGNPPSRDTMPETDPDDIPPPPPPRRKR